MTKKKDTIEISKDTLKNVVIGILVIVIAGFLFSGFGSDNGGAGAAVAVDGKLSGVELYKSYADEIGLDTKEFDKCLDSGAMAKEVAKDMADGQAAGVQGTPAFFIDGELISGAQPFSVFKVAIDAALANPTPTDMTELMEDDAIFGDKNAAVTIVEWSDFECPFCTRAYDNALKQVKSEYVDKGLVNIVYRDFPLGFHQNAQKAAEAAECAGEQGEYYAMHDMLFEQGV